ncbi:MAG: hypothetical protein ACYCT7_03170 [bacterium]
MVVPVPINININFNVNLNKIIDMFQHKIKNEVELPNAYYIPYKLGLNYMLIFNMLKAENYKASNVRIFNDWNLCLGEIFGNEDVKDKLKEASKLIEIYLGKYSCNTDSDKLKDLVNNLSTIWIAIKDIIQYNNSLNKIAFLCGSDMCMFMLLAYTNMPLESYLIDEIETIVYSISLIRTNKIVASFTNNILNLWNSNNIKDKQNEYILPYLIGLDYYLRHDSLGDDFKKSVEKASKKFSTEPELLTNKKFIKLFEKFHLNNLI